MSLFVLASKDGWVNIMYTGLDGVGIDQQVSDSISLAKHSCVHNFVTCFKQAKNTVCSQKHPLLFS